MNQDISEPKCVEPYTRLAEARLGHEINNLIQPLCANLQTLAAFWDALAPALPEHPGGAIADIRSAMPEVLSEMHDCLDRIAGMVRAAKAAPGAFHLQSQPLINPQTALTGALRILHARIGKTEIVMDMPAAAPPAIRGNAAELTQVFVNLILNALAAARMAPAPRVKLVCRVEASERIELEISDNGSGIAPEIADRLFQPFASTRRSEGGTGLGLHICHEIIRRHQGAIKAANSAGGGAVFTVTLPTADTEL